jgi:hypothetical protein
MSIGTVERPNAGSFDALSSTVVTTTDFSLSTTQLAAMAKTDDLFKNAMNIVNNYGTYGGAGVWYQLRPDFSWTGDYATLTTAYSSPAMTFKGMSFQLDTNSTSMTMATICSSQAVTVVELYPPSSITDTANNTFDQNTPISNIGATCTPLNSSQEAWGTDFSATDAYAEPGANGGKISYSVPADFLTVPSGEWTWKENGTNKAIFNINAVSPPYVIGPLTPKGFVPSFKLNVTGTQIDSIDVQWYYYDELLAGYVLLATNDLDLLKHFIGRLEVKFDVTYNSTRNTCEMYFDPTTTSHIVPSDFVADSSGCSQTWYYNDTNHPATNTGLMGFYESGGFGYFFHFFVP